MSAESLKEPEVCSTLVCRDGTGTYRRGLNGFWEQSGRTFRFTWEEVLARVGYPDTEVIILIPQPRGVSVSGDSVNPNRTVHGVALDGRTVARYDRTGQYYLEDPAGKRQRLRVSLRLAAFACADGAHFPCRPGGLRLDAEVRRIKESRSAGVSR